MTSYYRDRDPMTPDEIRAAARNYNREYPEAVAEIEAGTPVLDVAAINVGKYGARIRLVATYGVRCPDGGFIAAEDPEVIMQKRRTGTETRMEVARRVFRWEARQGVDIRFRLVGL